MQWINRILILSVINLNLVNSESPAEALIRYIEIDINEGKKALNEIQIQKTNTENILDYLYQNIIPTLSLELQNFNEQIKSLQDDLNTFGISDTLCQKEVQKLVNSDLNPSMTFTKVYKEKTEIYDIILAYITEEGKNKINALHSKVTTMWTEVRNCQESASPSICAAIVHKKILDRIEKCPQEYGQAVQNAQALMNEHENEYKNRSVTYVEEIERNLKPFLILMKSCVRLQITKLKNRCEAEDSTDAV